MSLRKVDLNLVPLLQTLLHEKSVSRTAHLIGLSQPAVSAALRRMRHVLDDELLVRVGAHMELTPRAVDLIEPLDRACENLEELLTLPRFDPAKAKRTIVIATPDQATFLFEIALREGIPIWTDSPVKNLVTSGGAVTGAVVERDGAAVEISARCGVLINAGGFSHDAQMRAPICPRQARSPGRRPIRARWGK